MITNYLVFHSTSLEELLTKVNGASEIGYHIVGTGSYGVHHQGYLGIPAAYLNPPVGEPLTHYVWMERYYPYGRYATVGPGVVVDNVLGRPIAVAAGVDPYLVRPGVDPYIVRPGVVQPVARGAVVTEPQAGFIKLTMADTSETFYVRPEHITGIFGHEGHTQVIAEQSGGGNSWQVKETPEQILELAQHPLYERRPEQIPLPRQD